MDAVYLMDYDPAWSERFHAEERWIRDHLPDDLCLCIEHVGSTAIPGMTAKPVIDILIRVSSLDRMKAEGIPVLEANGYSYWAANPDTTRLFLVKGLPPNGPRSHHLHIAEPGHENEDKIVFRDYLRRNDDAVHAYARLKRDLAVQFSQDREAYTAAKAEFVASILKQARATLENEHDTR